MDVSFIVLTIVCLVTFFKAQGDDNRVALKIHAGSNALPGMFPSIGYIVDTVGVNSCGATLISQEWAVSAAHCFFGLGPAEGVPVRVVFGDIDVTEVTYHHQESCFEAIIHEDYNDDTLENDIALIRLKNPVNITEFVKPVDLFTTFADTTTFRTCFVVGWGATENYIYPDALQFTEVSIQNASLCDSQPDMESMFQSQSDIFYESEPFYEDLMICAGSETSDACDGDSGGPLYCINDLTKKQILVGIVSSGQMNCTPGLNGVYTRISAYADWIEQTSDGQLTTFSLCFLAFITYCGKILYSI